VAVNELLGQRITFDEECASAYVVGVAPPEVNGAAVYQ
jgi:hypothetical protein